MKSPVVCLLALCATAASVHAQNSPVTDPMKLIPASSRHVFLLAPPNSWAKIQYLRPQGKDMGFIVLDSSTKPDLKTDWREVSYFEDAKEKDPDNFLKRVRIRADGGIEHETDHTSTQEFNRSFDRRGNVKLYFYSIGIKNIAAFSVGPDGNVSHFDNGSGDLLVWDEEVGHYTHIWYFKSGLYLSKYYIGGNCYQTALRVGNDGEFSFSSKEEQLAFFSHHETWWEDFGKPIRAQVDDDYINGKDGSIVKYNFVDDDVKKRIRQGFGFKRTHGRPDEDKPDPILLQQLEKDYITSVASLDFGLDSVGKCLFCLHHLFFESTKSDVFGVKWPVLAPRVSFEALWGAPRRN